MRLVTSLAASEKPQFRSQGVHRPSHELLMLCDEAVKGAAAHPLRFFAYRVDDSWFPSETCSEPVGAAYRAATRVFSGTGVGELMTVPAGDDSAPIRDRDSASASHCRADEPVAGAAKRARRSGDLDGVLLVLPVPAAFAMSVHQDHAFLFGAHLD